MPWIEPNRDIIEQQVKFTFQMLYENTFNKDCIIMGGCSSVDDYKFSKDDFHKKFVIQLNHHILRRRSQPVHWLIARAGSGMCPKIFETIPEAQRNKLIAVSCACNKHTFTQWVDSGYSVFPFFEQAFLGNNPYSPSLEWCNQFWIQIRSNPFVGMIALKMALMMPFKSIELVGFNFFQGTNKVVPSKLGCHYIDVQKDWLRDQYNTDFRIILDKRMIEILGMTDKIRGLMPTFEVSNNPEPLKP